MRKTSLLIGGAVLCGVLAAFGSGVADDNNNGPPEGCELCPQWCMEHCFYHEECPEPCDCLDLADIAAVCGAACEGSCTQSCGSANQTCEQSCDYAARACGDVSLKCEDAADECQGSSLACGSTTLACEDTADTCSNSVIVQVPSAEEICEPVKREEAIAALVQQYDDASWRLKVVDRPNLFVLKARKRKKGTIVGPD